MVGSLWQGGLDGLKDQSLKDQSRKPHSSPKQTSSQVQEALLQARRDHATWGPKKLLAYLQPRRLDLSLPAAASTVGELLKQHGLAQPRKRPARSWKHPGEPTLRADAPNQTWCADFKGQFPTKDGKECFPLTLTDAYSRFVLCCHGLPSVRQEGALPLFERAFSYLDTGYLQMDNGRHRMYRWYAANPVRFQSSLKVQIQNQRWAEGSQIPSRDDYTSVVFWYQDQPQSVTLAPFAARTAPSQAVEYAKKP